MKVGEKGEGRERERETQREGERGGKHTVLNCEGGIE